MNIESKMIWLNFDDNTDDLIDFFSKNIEKNQELSRSRLFTLQLMWTFSTIFWKRWFYSFLFAKNVSKHFNRQHQQPSIKVLSTLALTPELWIRVRIRSDPDQIRIRIHSGSDPNATRTVSDLSQIFIRIKSDPDPSEFGQIRIRIYSDSEPSYAKSGSEFSSEIRIRI